MVAICTIDDQLATYSNEEWFIADALFTTRRSICYAVTIKA